MGESVRIGAVLFVNDLDRIAAFYTDVLGLRETHRSSDHIVLESPGYEFVVHRAFGDEAKAVASSGPVPRRSQAAFKPVFFVPDLTRARGAVERRGGVMDPIERAWSFNGVTVCDAVDPEGNVIQLRAPR